MVTELDKYRAQCLQIYGLGLMTPFGKLILNILEYELEDLNLYFIFYGIIAFLFFLLGIIFVFRGEVHLQERRERWIQEQYY